MKFGIVKLINAINGSKEFATITTRDDAIEIVGKIKDANIEISLSMPHLVLEHVMHGFQTSVKVRVMVNTVFVAGGSLDKEESKEIIKCLEKIQEDRKKSAAEKAYKLVEEYL